MSKDTKFKYKGYCFKLDERTVKAFKDIKNKENLSWNRLFFKVLQSYENKNK